jgi:predicted nucleic acid-binding protein
MKTLRPWTGLPFQKTSLRLVGNGHRKRAARFVILYLLDTNIISYMLMGKSRAARAKLKSLRDNEVACVSTVTEGELRYALAKNPRSQTRTVLYGFLNRLRVFPWGGMSPPFTESRARRWSARERRWATRT